MTEQLNSAFVNGFMDMLETVLEERGISFLENFTEVDLENIRNEYFELIQRLRTLRFGELLELEL